MVRVEDLRRDLDGEFAPRVGGPLRAELSFAVGRQRWTVHESVDHVTLASVLIFTTDGIARRVRHYPPDWRELSSQGLGALSWST